MADSLGELTRLFLNDRSSWLRQHWLMVYAVVFNVLGSVADILSSLHLAPWGYEANPWVRSSFYQIVPARAAMLDAFYFVGFLLILIPIYLSVRHYSEFVAQWLFSAYFLYDGLISFFVVVHNLFIRWGWHVTASDLSSPYQASLLWLRATLT